MYRNYYLPIRQRQDGSIYIDRNHLLKEVITYALFLFVIPLILTAIVIFTLAAPSKTETQLYVNEAPGAAPGTDESLPSIFPVQGRLTSKFGYRRNPFGGRSEFHPGQDIAAALGTPVVAPADGEVIFAGQKTGYGNFVIIRHANGIITRYGHLLRYMVAADQAVKCNDVIGEVGSTGRSTGPHLHYEVWVNYQKVDPMGYLPR